MTVFYCFPTSQPMQGEFVRPDGINVSVIGDHFAPEPDPLPEDYEPEFLGFLVNASSTVDEWSAYEVTPSSPMRIFG